MRYFVQFLLIDTVERSPQEMGEVLVAAFQERGLVGQHLYVQIIDDPAIWARLAVDLQPVSATLSTICKEKL